MNQIFDLQFPSWPIWIMLAAVLLAGVKFAKRKEWQEEPWSLDVSKGILGLFAVLIIMHHLVQAVTNRQAPSFGGAPAMAGFLFLENFGVCFVGGFFFFSGYGLMKSKNSKQDYFKGFFSKRFLKVLIPFYVCILVFVLVNLAMGQKYTGVEMIGVFTGFFLINSHMWYIVEIVILYLLFFLLFRFIKKQNIALILMGILIVAMIIGSLFFGHGPFWFQGEWWYNTTLLFYIGMLVALKEEAVLGFARKFYMVLLPVCLVAFVALYKATVYMLTTYSYWSEFFNPPGYLDKFRCLSCQLPMVIVFMFIVLLLMLKIRFSNGVLKFLGEISLELYLIHNLFLMGFRTPGKIMIQGTFSYVIAVLVCSLVLAFLLHQMDQLIIRLLSGKKENQ